MEADKQSVLFRRNQNGDSIWRGGVFRIITGPIVVTLTVLAGLFWWLFPSVEREISSSSPRNWKAAEVLEPSLSWSMVGIEALCMVGANGNRLNRLNPLSIMIVSMVFSVPVLTSRWTIIELMGKGVAWRLPLHVFRPRFP